MNWIQGVFFIVISWVVSEARFRQDYESPERSIDRRVPRDYYSSYHKPHHVTDGPADTSRYPRPRGRVNEPDEPPIDSRYPPRPRPRVSKAHYGPRDRPLDSRDPHESFEAKRYRRPDGDFSRHEIDPRSPHFPSTDHNRQRSDLSDRSSRIDKLQLQKTAFEKLNRLDKDARKNLHKTIAKLAKVNDAIKANVEKIPKIVKKTCAMRKEATNPSNGNHINANEKILIFKRDTKSSSKSSTEESSSFDVSSSESKSKSESISSDMISLSSFSQSTEESSYADISGDLLITDSNSHSRLGPKSSRRYTRPQRARPPPRIYPSRHSRELHDHRRSFEHHLNSRYHHSASY